MKGQGQKLCGQVTDLQATLISSIMKVDSFWAKVRLHG